MRTGNLKDLPPNINAIFTKQSEESLDNRYKELREVGRGSFGTVFYAEDLNYSGAILNGSQANRLLSSESSNSNYSNQSNLSDKTKNQNPTSQNASQNANAVALKKMNFSGKNADDYWKDIINEVSCLAKLQPHEHILKLYNCHLLIEQVWLVCEYCIGSATDVIETLAIDFKKTEQSGKTSVIVGPEPNQIKPFPKITEIDIAAILSQTTLALNFMHTKNLIHRDIKAGNILFHESNQPPFGTIKLADFGSACNKNPANSFVGSPYWMAPEVILAMEDGKYDERVDIWSLGITSIELTEKRPPLFNVNQMSALYQIPQIEPPTLRKKSEASAYASQNFKNFIKNVLNKDPENRPRAGDIIGHELFQEYDLVDAKNQITTQKCSKIIFDLIESTKLALHMADKAKSPGQNVAFYKKLQEINDLNDRKREKDAETQEPIEPDTTPPPSPEKADTFESLKSSQNSNSLSSSTNINIKTHLIDQPKSVISSVNGSMSIHSEDTLSQSSVSENNLNGKKINQNQNPDKNLEKLEEKEVVQEVIVPPKINTSVTSLSRPESSPKDPKEDPQNSKFSTLRSVKTLAKIRRAKPNEVLEQLDSYKRLRQAQKRQLDSLQEEHNKEIARLNEKASKELNNLMNQNSDELAKSRKKKISELEKFIKNQNNEDKEFNKKLRKLQETKIKEYQKTKKKELSRKKESLTEEVKKIPKTSPRFGSGNGSGSSSHSSRSDYLSHQISILKQKFKNEENTFIASTKQNMNLEHRKFQKRLLEARHIKEREDMKDNTRWTQIQVEYDCAIRQHDSTIQIKRKQFENYQELKRKQLMIQHETEKNNQEQYMRQCQNDLRRKHAKDNKNEPKVLKETERAIKAKYKILINKEEQKFLNFKSAADPILFLQNDGVNMAAINSIFEDKFDSTSQISSFSNSTNSTFHSNSNHSTSAQKKKFYKFYREEINKRTITHQENFKTELAETINREKYNSKNYQKQQTLLLSDKLQKELDELEAFQQQVKLTYSKAKDADFEKLQNFLNAQQRAIENTYLGRKNGLKQEIEGDLKRLKERHYKELREFDVESSKLGFSSVNNLVVIDARAAVNTNGVTGEKARSNIITNGHVTVTPINVPGSEISSVQSVASSISENTSNFNNNHSSSNNIEHVTVNGHSHTHLNSFNRHTEHLKMIEMELKQHQKEVPRGYSGY